MVHGKHPQHARLAPASWQIVRWGNTAPFVRSVMARERRAAVRDRVAPCRGVKGYDRQIRSLTFRNMGAGAGASGRFDSIDSSSSRAWPCPGCRSSSAAKLSATPDCLSASMLCACALHQVNASVSFPCSLRMQSAGVSTTSDARDAAASAGSLAGGSSLPRARHDPKTERELW